MLCPVCISTGKVGVVQKMGQFTGVQEPGCSLICVPFTTVTPVSLAVQQLQCTSDCKTKDNVTVTVSTAVQYRILKEQVKTAFFDVVDPQRMMMAEVDNILRSTLPQLTLDESYESKEKIVSDIKTALKSAMDKYGYDVINVLITDLQPEKSVLKAMNDINASRRQREAANEKGEADKVLKIKASEADAEAKRLAGQGLAQMRAQLAQGFQESMKVMKDSGMTEADAMQMMIMTQYLDTLKEFAQGHGSIIVPHGPSAVKDIEAQIRDGFLTANQRPKQMEMGAGASKRG